MVSTQEAKEREQLNSFLENTKSLPSYQKIERGEDPPDFVLYYRNKKFCIELTELFKHAKSKYSEQQLEDAEIKIIKGVRAKIEKCELPIIEIKVYFSELSNPQQGYNVSKTIANVSDLIIKKIKVAPPDFEKITIEADETKTEGIFKICIRNCIYRGKRWLQKTRLNPPQKCHWVKVDPVEEIQERIKEKEKKLQNYQNKYEQSYLLITTNRYKGSQAFECTKELKKIRFDMVFDRIFFFDYFTKTAFELKKKQG
jgi:hypothetical protein